MSPPWEFFANPVDSNYDFDLDDLAKSARKSFGIIELWQKQKSFDNLLIKALVDKIVKQGPAYNRAIQKSAETAENGRFFARDAVDFCKRLLRAEDSVDILKSSLEEIKQVAKVAHFSSTEMNKLFKLVRTELFKISKELPSNIVGSRADRDVINQFERARDDLNTLILHVGCFVDWWGEMNTSLANLEDILPRIKVDSTNPFRTVTVQQRWMKVHDEYVSYQRQIGEVEEYYNNISGDMTPPPSAIEIERLSVDDTVALMLAEQRQRKEEIRKIAEEKQLEEERHLRELEEAKRASTSETTQKDLEVKPADEEKLEEPVANLDFIVPGPEPNKVGAPVQEKPKPVAVTVAVAVAKPITESTDKERVAEAGKTVEKPKVVAGKDVKGQPKVADKVTIGNVKPAANKEKPAKMPKVTVPKIKPPTIKGSKEKPKVQPQPKVQLPKAQKTPAVKTPAVKKTTTSTTTKPAAKKPKCIIM